MALDISAIRRQFPAFSPSEEGKTLIYLDSAATAQVPLAVLGAAADAERTGRGNPHRGVHGLAELATDRLSQARTAVAQCIGAHAQEIIFTKNCTESLNLVARSWGKTMLRKGDAIVLTVLEHHSNIVPWLQLKEETGVEILWVDIDETGMPDLTMLDAFLSRGNVKLVSVTGQSNVLGVRPPLKEIIERAHAAGALTVVDAAQLIAHHRIDVRELNCDFLTFSGHKLYGPTGVGVLYGKRNMLASMPPFLGGGGMIGSVKHNGFTVADIPERFEAGTPPLTQIVGLAAAIEWFGQFSPQDIETHEASLITHAIRTLSDVPKMKLLPHHASSSCISFVHPHAHPHDLTDLLGKRNICLRAGHHCAQLLHEALGIGASTRLSVGLYNTEEEITDCVTAIREILRVLS